MERLPFSLSDYLINPDAKMVNVSGKKLITKTNVPIVFIFRRTHLCAKSIKIYVR